MEKKFTKGNWVVKRKPHTTKYKICYEEMGLDYVSKSEADANLNLIIAAPQLFFKLEEILEKTSNIKEMQECRDSINELLTSINK